MHTLSCLAQSPNRTAWQEFKTYSWRACWSYQYSYHTSLWDIGNNFSIIFKTITENSNLGTHCEIALRWMPQHFINEQLTLFQVMAWCHQATSHYLSSCWPRSMLPYGITGTLKTWGKWIQHDWWCQQQFPGNWSQDPSLYHHVTLPMLETKYSRFGDQYHSCWCPGSLSRQGISRHGIDSIRYATCRVAPLEIWSPSVEQIPRCDTKCEYIFHNLKYNSASWIITYKQITNL